MWAIYHDSSRWTEIHLAYVETINRQERFWVTSSGLTAGISTDRPSLSHKLSHISTDTLLILPPAVPHQHTHVVCLTTSASRYPHCAEVLKLSLNLPELSRRFISDLWRCAAAVTNCDRKSAPCQPLLPCRHVLGVRPAAQSANTLLMQGHMHFKQCVRVNVSSIFK